MGRVEVSLEFCFGEKDILAMPEGVLSLWGIGGPHVNTKSMPNCS